MPEQEEQDQEIKGDADVPAEAEGAVNEAPTEKETPIEQIRQLKARLEALEKELAEEREKATDYMNRAMRAQADASNMRKRLQQDLNLALRDALKSVVYEQLGVLDSFD